MALLGMEYEEDTGWTALNSTYGVYYKKLNGVVFLRIGYNGAIPQDTLLGTLPQGYIPAYSFRSPNYTNANGIGFVAISTDGKVTKGGSGTDWMYIMCSYPAT